jgi:hypothetical protein
MAPLIHPETLYNDLDLCILFGFSADDLAEARKSEVLRFSLYRMAPLYLGEWVMDWLSTMDEYAGVYQLSSYGLRQAVRDSA